MDSSSTSGSCRSSRANVADYDRTDRGIDRGPGAVIAPQLGWHRATLLHSLVPLSAPRAAWDLEYQQIEGGVLAGATELAEVGLTLPSKTTIRRLECEGATPPCVVRAARGKVRVDPVRYGMRRIEISIPSTMGVRSPWSWSSARSRADGLSGPLEALLSGRGVRADHRELRL